MSVARKYRMVAQPGRGDALAAAIEAVTAGIRDVEGCEDIILLREQEAPDELWLIEKWATVAHHQQALANMPPGALDAIGALLAGPPEGSYADWIV